MAKTRPGKLEPKKEEPWVITQGLEPGEVEIRQVRNGCTVEVQLDKTKLVMVLLYKTPGSAVVSTSKIGTRFYKQVEYGKVERVSLSTPCRVIKNPPPGFDAKDYVRKLEVNHGNNEPKVTAEERKIMKEATAKGKPAAVKSATKATPAKAGVIEATKKPAPPAKQGRDKEMDAKIKTRAEALIAENKLTYKQIHEQLTKEFGDKFTKSVSWLGNLGYYMRQDGRL